MGDGRQSSVGPREALTRRQVLVSAAGTALGVSGLAGCADGDGSSTGGYGAGTTTGARPSDGPTTAASEGGNAAPELVRLAEVPVGGVAAVEDSDGNPVIVAQPRRGEVAAFSAVCTHRGCTVAPDGDVLRCPCHGSTFELTTGDNTGGPAPSPLPPVRVSVVDGMVVEG